jgi:hypothetical protein
LDERSMRKKRNMQSLGKRRRDAGDAGGKRHARSVCGGVLSPSAKGEPEEVPREVVSIARGEVRVKGISCS